MEPSENMSVQQIDALLAFLPLFEQLGYMFGSREAPSGHFPFLASSPEVMDFITTLYDHHIIIPFDWTNWTDTAQRYMNDPTALDTADLPTLRKLLITHVRADRFTEGHLAQQLTSGHITAILRRLQTLRDTGYPS